MFKWLEDRLSERSKLVISRKEARAIDVDGNEVVVPKEFAKAFTYAPDKPPGGKVRLLFAADRYLYTAEGVSYIGINSGKHIAPDVVPRTLLFENEPLTSAELDYLAGSLALGTLPAKK